jgi:hypothetical protein
VHPYPDKEQLSLRAGAGRPAGRTRQVLTGVTPGLVLPSHGFAWNPVSPYQARSLCPLRTWAPQRHNLAM